MTPDPKTEALKPCPNHSRYTEGCTACFVETGTSAPAIDAELAAELIQKGGDESCRTIHCAVTPVIDTGGPAEGHPVPNVRSDAPVDVQSVDEGQDPWTGNNDIMELVETLMEIEIHCPCGARPESLNTHPHVIGCPVEKSLRIAEQLIHTRATAIERDAEVAALREALKECEWVQRTNDDGAVWRECPSCGSDAPKHSVDCKLSKALASTAGTFTERLRRAEEERDLARTQVTVWASQAGNYEQQLAAVTGERDEARAKTQSDREGAFRQQREGWKARATAAESDRERLNG